MRIFGHLHGGRRQTTVA